jgi:hypothetical protein
VAQRYSTGNRTVRTRPLWVEDVTRLVVAVPARCALQPDNVTPGIKHKQRLCLRRTDPDLCEVLSAPIRETGDNWRDERAVGMGRKGEEGMEAVNTSGVTV